MTGPAGATGTGTGSSRQGLLRLGVAYCVILHLMAAGAVAARSDRQVIARRCALLRATEYSA